MTHYRSIIAVLMVSTLSACQYFKPPLPKHERALVPEAYMAIPHAEHVIDSPQWGLALSGGGIRSATVAIGAVKALYDRDVLNKIDVVSTVSGGGYAAYWLYSREYRGDLGINRRFGATSFEDSAFLEEVCGIATTNNFISTPKVLVKGIFGQSTTRAYSNAIRRTYGQANYDLADSYETGVIVEPDTIEFHELQEAVRLRGIPNWVVNARVYRPNARAGYYDGMYELTPFGRGSGMSGYEPWPLTHSYPILNGVSASGAAVAFALDRTLSSEVAAAGRKVQLSDGGHGENLGVLALVRRRVPNIIVIDAEEDEKLNLDSYIRLKNRLLAWGDTLAIADLDSLVERGDDIPWRPASGTMVGSINGTDYRATVYYTKLSVPRSLDQVIVAQPLVQQRGRDERDEIMRILKDGERIGRSARTWDCRLLADHEPDLYPLAIHEISRFISAKDLESESVPRAWKKFPHKSTLDLGYNIDRTMAQVAIGYLLGEELSNRVRAELE